MTEPTPGPGELRSSVDIVTVVPLAALDPVMSTETSVADVWLEDATPPLKVVVAYEDATMFTASSNDPELFALRESPE